jgi:hypothetical protein
VTDLATTADLEARLGRSLSGTEATRATAYLADASALIRNYSRQTFTAVAGDVVRLRPVGTEVRLPERPVTAVHSVTAIGWAGIPSLVLPLTFWGFDGIDIVTIAPFNSDLWLNLPIIEIAQELPDTYEINYDHGDDDVPDDVVAICCGVVNRILLAPSLVEGMSSERIGQYSYQMSQQVNGGSAGAAVKLTDTDKDALSRYRRQATSVQLRL